MIPSLFTTWRSKWETLNNFHPFFNILALAYGEKPDVFFNIRSQIKKKEMHRMQNHRSSFFSGKIPMTETQMYSPKHLNTLIYYQNFLTFF